MNQSSSNKRTKQWWDSWFLGLAVYASTASKDPSTKCGAVVVNPERDKIFYGYNGFPGSIEDKEEWLADRPTKLATSIHAEMNAILKADCSVRGWTLYVNNFPCSNCAKHVIAKGIVEIHYIKNDDLAKRWADSFTETRLLFERAGVKVVEHDLSGVGP